MDATQQDCTDVKQQAIVRILWAEGMKPTEIRYRMLVQYENENSMTQRETKTCNLQQKQSCQKILLHHDNACPHAVVIKVKVEAMQQLQFEHLLHSSYSTDLEPSDYHFFCPFN